MMQHNFVAASANIGTLDPEAENMSIVLQSREAVLNKVMSNSFGFGGTQCHADLSALLTRQSAAIR